MRFDADLSSGTLRGALCGLLLLALAAPAARAQCITERAKFHPSDASSHREFGRWIAFDGQTLVAGVTFPRGGVHVFSTDGTTWVDDAEILASDGVAGDRFGSSVSIHGDTIAVGAFGEASGAVYVYVRNGAAWDEQAKLVASDGMDGDAMGVSVSLFGDTIVAGAPHVGGVNPPGAAYVFVRDGTTWTEEAKLTASDAGARDSFGESISLWGDTIVVGASGNDDAGERSGSAYVFVRNGSTWSEQAKLTASDAAAGDVFGFPVTLGSETALVSAAQDDDMGSASGSVYVFTRTGTSWAETAKLVASDGAAGDLFGVALSISDDRGLVGACFDDPEGANSGSAYVFTRAGASWSEALKLLPSDGEVGDNFGLGVALAGDTAVVGSPRDDDAGFEAGAAYVYDLTDEAFTTYCTSKPSSLDCLPGIGFTGAPTLSGADGFFVTADQVVAQRTGFLLWGLSAKPIGPPGPFEPIGSSPRGGRLCVFAPVVAATRDSGGTPGTCDGTFAVHFSQALMAGAGVGAGTSVYTQYFYRDPDHPDGTGVGHTNALRFCVRD